MKRAAILDRDGVINEFTHEVNQPDDLVLFPDVAPAIRLLRDHGFLVCVATNQGGVGLGYMTDEQLHHVHGALVERLAQTGADLDWIASCTHAPRANCPCRKPKPGLLLELQRRLHFSLRHSYMVGDRETDISAGTAAGVRTVRIAREASSVGTKADYTAHNLLEAAEWIVQDADAAGRTAR